MARATINGVDTHYEVHGAGVPLLFIHGGYGGAATTLVPQLTPEIIGVLPTDRVQTIVYDRRCAGRTQYVTEPYTQVDLAEDARALLDHLGIERAIIVGSSAGGPIALQFALTHPDRTIALGLPNTSSYLWRARPRTRAYSALLAQRQAEGDRAVFEGRKEALRTPPPAFGPNGGRPEARERVAMLKEALANASDEVLFDLSTGELRNVAAAWDYDYTSRLGELRMPVCVIHGTSDNTVPFEWGRALHEGIAGSEFHPIEGADHGVLAYPAAAEALRAWVEQRRRSATSCDLHGRW
jgi:3-oxoadipate enol-lactonase